MMNGGFFEGRHLAAANQFVRTADLAEGSVYYRVAYLDHDLMLPEVRPMVFVGRNLHGELPGLYFQDAGSYLGGERIDVDTFREGRVRDAEFPVRRHPALEPWFEVLPDGEFTCVQEFEPALEAVLECSLRRRGWNGVIRPCRVPQQ